MLGAPTCGDLAMVTIVELPVEPMTAAEFAPFGHLIASRPNGNLGTRPEQDYWRLPFNLEGRLELELVRYHAQPWEFSRLERHVNVTESRVAIGGHPAVIVAAPPTRD